MAERVRWLALVPGSGGRWVFDFQPFTGCRPVNAIRLVSTMTIDQFWKIIEDVHRESGTDIDRRFEVLEAELGNLSLVEVQSFDMHFTDCLDRAFTWELWGAAYVISGAWSDDGFWDFRSTLITYGREIFELALNEPDSLAALDAELGTNLQVEGLQYIAREVAERLGGDLLDRAQPHPQEPRGRKLEGLAVADIYPKLWKKYATESNDR
jgi:hypothetical protein